jgi:hypothetical protein
MLRYRVLGLLLGAALVCFGGRARACTMDNECPGDQICQTGQCVVPPPPAAAPASAAAPAPSTPVVEPPPPATPPKEPDESQLPRRSVPMMVGGAVMIPVGALVLAIAVMTSSHSDCKEDEFGRVSSEEMDRCDNTTRKVVLGITGAALVGGGIPLVVIGSKRVPAARAGLAPWLSRDSAGLNLRLEL